MERTLFSFPQRPLTFIPKISHQMSEIFPFPNLGTRIFYKKPLAHPDASTRQPWTCIWISGLEHIPFSQRAGSRNNIAAFHPTPFLALVPLSSPCLHQPFLCLSLYFRNKAEDLLLQQPFLQQQL